MTVRRPPQRPPGAARRAPLVGCAHALALTLALGACGDGPRLVVSWDAAEAEAELPAVVAALRARAPQRALDELDRLAAAGASPDGALHFRALALGDLGRAEEAIATWTKELDVHPGNGRGHASLASLLIERGELERAARHLGEARRHAPDLPVVLLLEGRLAMLHDDDERARRSFRDYLMRDPYGVSASEAYHALAQIAARSGPEGGEEARRLQEVGKQLEQVHAYLGRYQARLAQDPDDVEAAYGVAAAYLNLYVNLHGDRRLLEQAEPALEHVLAREPRHAQALNNLGFVRLEQQREAEARGYLQAAVQADPEFAPARLNLGTLLRKTGERDEAVRQLEAALAVADTDVDRARAHLQLGLAAEQLGTPEGLRAAIAHLRVALELLPADPMGAGGLIDDLQARLAAAEAGADGDGGASPGPGTDDAPR